MRSKTISKTTTPHAISRREFFRKCAVGALLATEAIVYSRMAVDRLSTKPSETERLSISRVENRDEEVRALQVPGLVKKRTVHGSFDGREVKITFVGVEHQKEYANIHSSKIAEIVSQEGSDIVATEFPVSMRDEGFVKDTPKEDYFTKLLGKMKSIGMKTALLEGYMPNVADMWGLFIINALTFTGLLKAAQYLKRRIFGEQKQPEDANLEIIDRLKRPLVFGHLFGGGLSIIQFGYVLTPLILGPVEKWVYRSRPDLDWADPVMLMQRNRYYAEVIRRLIEIGNRNIVVVTGSAHTDGTIKRLEDERIPASDQFRKHFFIISPDGSQQKVSTD